jgi:hypothetical protein
MRFWGDLYKILIKGAGSVGLFSLILILNTVLELGGGSRKYAIGQEDHIFSHCASSISKYGAVLYLPVLGNIVYNEIISQATRHAAGIKYMTG